MGSVSDVFIYGKTPLISVSIETSLNLLSIKIQKSDTELFTLSLDCP